MYVQPDVDVPAPRRQAEVSRADAPGVTLNVEALVWVLVIAAAAGWRLVQLGSGLPSAAEALPARAAWEFARGTTTLDWPGDLTSALAALAIKLGGDGIGWVRLWPALCGLLCVGALALLRPFAGRSLPLLAALFIACSPVAIAASRSLSPDTAGLLGGLLLLWLVLRTSEHGDVRALPPLGAVAGVALGTGAVAVALALLASMWLAIEIAWLGRDDVAQRWRRAMRDGRAVRLAVALALPGLALGLVRYGAGPDRISLAALQDWNAPSGIESYALPWHAAVSLSVLYEPLVLALGVTGFVLLVRRWRRDGAFALSGFERLLVVWASGGLLLSLTALHQRPGQVLVFTLPVALLAARATLAALPSLAAFRLRESGLPLAAAAAILGYVALQLMSWAHDDLIPRDEAAGVLALAIVCAGLIGYALFRSPAAVAGVAMGAAWLVTAWLSPHGAAAVLFRGGNEPVFGQRAMPEQVALVRDVEAALAEGRTVSVERPLADALAWELRGLGVRVHDGLPPPVALVIRRPDQVVPEGFTAGSPVQVEQRWYPSDWETTGVIRWVLYRAAWGDVDLLRGEELRNTSQ